MGASLGPRTICDLINWNTMDRTTSRTMQSLKELLEIVSGNPTIRTVIDQLITRQAVSNNFYLDSPLGPTGPNPGVHGKEMHGVGVVGIISKISSKTGC